MSTRARRTTSTCTHRTRISSRHTREVLRAGAAVGAAQVALGAPRSAALLGACFGGAAGQRFLGTHAVDTVTLVHGCSAATFWGSVTPELRYVTVRANTGH